MRLQSSKEKQKPQLGIFKHHQLQNYDKYKNYKHFKLKISYELN